MIGDTVAAIPPLNAVRRHYGKAAHITALHNVQRNSPVSPRDILEPSGVVDDFISYRSFDPDRARGVARGALVRSLDRIRKILSTFDLWRRLILRRFDEVVYLAASDRSREQVRRDAVFFRLSGVPVGRTVIARIDLPADMVADDTEGEISRRLRRLEFAGIDTAVERDSARPFLILPDVARQTAAEWLRRNRRYPDRPLVALCPGSRMPANRWPLENFLELGRRLLALQSYEIVVVGGPSERDDGVRLVSSWGDGINAAGELSILASAAVLQSSVLMIGLDTGTTHLGAATGTRCVAVYGGREPPGLWDPVGATTVIRHPVPCVGCGFQVCPLPHHPCLNDLDADPVWSTITAVLQGVYGKEGAQQATHS